MGRFFSLAVGGFLARASIRLQGNRDLTRRLAAWERHAGLELRRPDRHCLGGMSDVQPIGEISP
jgi:hypothetical protein